MKRRVAFACGAALLSGSLASHLHAQAATARTHVDAARAAIAPKGADPKKAPPFHVFQALFDQACQEPKLPDAMRTNDRSAVVPRKEWFAWPANIFDNLYFIGTRTAGVWAVNTPEGIIVIDANFHYSSKELVLGLLNFGLDPKNIKYVIITHAHDDRYWGAKGLQDTYPNARIAMSAADWDLV
ncbi:MAG TPA: MBL fold metallo-hydrolase, partial [Vicinamibacterales bacterium]|nr:MBL fold metallo-hydrolase [Vicinamibacterales bacterium]